MKIALLREAGGLGDMVMTEPVVRGLRALHPGAEIVYVGLRDYAELVEIFDARPDVYLPIERRERRDRDAAPDAGRWPYLAPVMDADRIVDLFCPAFAHERAFKDRTHKSRVELFCRAAGAEASCPSVRVREADRDWARGYLAAKGWMDESCGPLVALAPWSCGKRRTWPKHKWKRLSRELTDRGFAPLSLHAFHAPLMGLAGLRAWGLPLPKVAALLNLCTKAVTNDSGILHLATAVGVPTLSLWGSTHPEVTLAHYPDAEWLWTPNAPGRPAACRAPCYSMRGTCDWRACRNGCAILAGIGVEEVLERIEAMGNGQ